MQRKSTWIRIAFIGIGVLVLVARKGAKKPRRKEAKSIRQTEQVAYHIRRTHLSSEVGYLSCYAGHLKNYVGYLPEGCRTRHLKNYVGYLPEGCRTRHLKNYVGYLSLLIPNPREEGLIGNSPLEKINGVFFGVPCATGSVWRVELNI